MPTLPSKKLTKYGTLTSILSLSDEGEEAMKHANLGEQFLKVGFPTPTYVDWRGHPHGLKPQGRMPTLTTKKLTKYGTLTSILSLIREGEEERLHDGKVTFSIWEVLPG